GGRCEACQGEGQRRIEMNFLPDVYVLCEVCNGRRYNQETLSVKFNGYSIADLLDLPIADAVPILKDIPTVNSKLQTLVDVGLGYIHLGQSATTLSGGEAQRMKLARELSKRQTGRTLYLLDEPTTALNFASRNGNSHAGPQSATIAAAPDAAKAPKTKFIAPEKKTGVAKASNTRPEERKPKAKKKSTISKAEKTSSQKAPKL